MSFFGGAELKEDDIASIPQSKIRSPEIKTGLGPVEADASGAGRGRGRE